MKELRRQQVLCTGRVSWLLHGGTADVAQVLLPNKGTDRGADEGMDRLVISRSRCPRRSRIDQEAAP